MDSRTKHAVVVAIDAGFDEIEALYAKYRLEEAGYPVFVIGPKGQETYLGRHGYPCRTDLPFTEIQARLCDGIVIPGGWAPARLRIDGKLKMLVGEFFRAGKLVATICHGGSVAISAEICRGLRMTGSPAILDDLRNAGALVEDASVVVDRNVITSRTTADLPHFLPAILQVLATGVAAREEQLTK
ncbi:MAG: type 1 glutamine amidotransferase domain-containing protein [Terriglobia bacterium]|jgi:protease I|nr:type 1 glutamine amidotransferase domain-containing protein [Terriglobia bacterium]